MKKVIVYVAGKARNPLSCEDVTRNTAVDNILRNISDKYKLSADLYYIYDHYPILTELNVTAINVDRKRSKDVKLELDLGNRHPIVSVYEGDRVCVEKFVNYINDDLERSMWNCAIKMVSDANIFIAVNPNCFSDPYKVLLDNLPPGCKRYWVGDLVRVNDLNFDYIEFGVGLEI